MANSTGYDLAIYRLTNNGDTESSIADDEAVGADYGATDSSTLAVTIFSWTVPSRRTDVPAPADKSMSNPDTGLTPLTLTIGLIVNEKNADNRKIGILTIFGLENKEVRGKFSKGRFGIRNDKKKTMNFVPTNTAGWKIVDVSVDDDLVYGGKADVVVTLQFGGKSSELVEEIQDNLPT